MLGHGPPCRRSVPLEGATQDQEPNLSYIPLQLEGCARPPCQTYRYADTTDTVLTAKPVRSPVEGRSRTTASGLPVPQLPTRGSPLPRRCHDGGHPPAPPASIALRGRCRPSTATSGPSCLLRPSTMRHEAGSSDLQARPSESPPPSRILAPSWVRKRRCRSGQGVRSVVVVASPPPRLTARTSAATARCPQPQIAATRAAPAGRPPTPGTPGRADPCTLTGSHRPTPSV